MSANVSAAVNKSGVTRARKLLSRLNVLALGAFVDGLRERWPIDKSRLIDEAAAILDQYDISTVSRFNRGLARSLKSPGAALLLDRSAAVG